LTVVCARPLTQADQTSQTRPDPTTSSPTEKTNQPFVLKRLQKRLYELTTLQKRLAQVVSTLKNHQKQAESLQKKLKVLGDKIPPEKLKAVLMESAAEAKAETETQGTKRHRLLEEAKVLDQAIGSALRPIPRPPAGETQALQLYESARTQQKQVTQLAEATKMAFRAIGWMDQMERTILKLGQ